MNIYTVELKNQPGELAHVCEVLGRAGVNIELAGATSGDHGIVYFAASDESARLRPWREPASSSERTRRSG